MKNTSDKSHDSLTKHPLNVIRPNFFPGQSLSDQDLTALMTWAEQRWRLDAACDDWGIACGLHVSIYTDPSANSDAPSQVLISPGYGFNAARQLCVVSDSDCGCEQPKYCRCRNKKGKTYSLPKANCSGCQNDKTKVLVGPLKQKEQEVKVSELAIFDLSLAPYACEEAHTLGLTLDGQRNCKPSRLKASAEVRIVPVSYTESCKDEVINDPTSPAIEFLKRYLPGESKVKVPERPETAFFSSDIQKFCTWLAEDVKRRPEIVCVPQALDSQSNSGLTEAKLTKILFWLVFGLRRARCCEASEASDLTIPLCRVWAKCVGTRYEILWIDESSPFRRSINCGPRKFNPTDWIGESFKATEQAASLAGVILKSTELDVPKKREDLKQLLIDELNLIAKPHPTMTAICISINSSQPDDGNCQIVVGFTDKDPPTQTPQPPVTQPVNPKDSSNTPVGSGENSPNTPVVKTTSYHASTTTSPTGGTPPAEPVATSAGAVVNDATANANPSS